MDQVNGVYQSGDNVPMASTDLAVDYIDDEYFALTRGFIRGDYFVCCHGLSACWVLISSVVEDDEASPADKILISYDGSQLSDPNQAVVCFAGMIGAKTHIHSIERITLTLTEQMADWAPPGPQCFQPQMI